MSQNTQISGVKRLGFLAMAGAGFFVDGYLNIVVGLGQRPFLTTRGQDTAD